MSGDGWDGERLKLLGDHSVFISPSVEVRSRSVEHRQPSGGPQLQALLACTLDYASSQQARAYCSIWYDGTLSFHRLRPCKFRIGASTRLAAGH